VKRKILGIPMDLRRPITKAEERVVKAALDWYYCAKVTVRGKMVDTGVLLHDAVGAYEKEAHR